MCRVLKYEVVCEKVDSYNTKVIDRKMKDSDDVADLLTKVLGMHKSPVERFIVVMLNTKIQLIGYQEIGIGCGSYCPVDIRAVFRAALLTGTCEAIVVAHNHPSGDPTPSEEDIELTEKIYEAGRILGIKVLDHIVVGDGKHVSIANDIGLNISTLLQKGD